MRNPIALWTDNNPFREMNQMQRFMDRWLGETSGRALPETFSPTCEVTEDKAHFYFKFDLPGLSKDQVKVELHENQLTVTGERKEEKKEDSKRYHFSEVSYGNFMRTFTLPGNIDTEKVEAKFDNGVLNVTVAKSENAKARQVNIK